MSNLLNEAKKVIASRWIDYLLAGGISLILLGILIFIFSAVFPDIRWLALAFSLLSVGLGCIALAMGGKSDARMKAMANLEFDEKLAMMAKYGRPIDSEESFVNVLYDTRAALRLKHWASKAMKSDFKDALAMVIREAKDIKDETLVKGLEDLWKAHNIDTW